MPSRPQSRREEEDRELPLSLGHPAQSGTGSPDRVSEDAQKRRQGGERIGADGNAGAGAGPGQRTGETPKGRQPRAARC